MVDNSLSEFILYFLYLLYYQSILQKVQISCIDISLPLNIQIYLYIYFWFFIEEKYSNSTYT